jgi:hypothetical protein
MRQKVVDAYPQNITSLEDFIRAEKIERMKSIPPSLVDYSEFLFSNYSISPNDMDFELVFMENSTQLEEYFTLLEITTSHLLQRSIPGRTVHILVREKNTNTIVGFITLGSPVINMKPRNTLFDVTNYAINPGLKVFNRSAYMGFIIVPVQPFGFNYIGGKLLSLMCVSHEIRDYLNTRYDMNAILFETTSLYGSEKSGSQYDGLKPFIRKGGQSESKFIPPMRDREFHELTKWLSDKIDDRVFTDSVSSRKMKIQSLIISIILRYFTDKNMVSEKEEFKSVLANIQNTLTPQKNYYYSTVGYENAINHMLTGEPLRKAPNYDAYSLNSLVEWWRKKSINRHNKLINEDRLRTRLEVWTDAVTQRNVDIIR